MKKENYIQNIKPSFDRLVETRYKLEIFFTEAMNQWIKHLFPTPTIKISDGRDMNLKGVVFWGGGVQLHIL